MTKKPVQKKEKKWDGLYRIRFFYRNANNRLKLGSCILNSINKVGIEYKPKYGKKGEYKGIIVGYVSLGYIITHNKKYKNIYISTYNNIIKIIKSRGSIKRIYSKSVQVITNRGTVISKYDKEYVVKYIEYQHFNSIIRNKRKSDYRKQKHVKKDLDYWENRAGNNLKDRKLIEERHKNCDYVEIRRKTVKKLKKKVDAQLKGKPDEIKENYKKAYLLKKEMLLQKAKEAKEKNKLDENNGENKSE